jgi:hypothetical protein
VSHVITDAPSSRSTLMEDVVNIFIKPSSVFENNRNKSFVMAAVVQSVIFLVLVFALKNLVSPYMDAEVARNMAKAAAKAAASGQPMPAGAGAMGEKIASIGGMIGPVLAPWFIAIFGGLFTWIAARIVGAKLTFGQSAMIAAWSGFPAVLSYIATGVQGALVDAGTVRGMSDASLGPARFVDPATTPAALLALLQNLDVFSLWTVILIAIGVAIVARVTVSSGVVASIVKWGIVVLISMVPAVMQS